MPHRPSAQLRAIPPEAWQFLYSKPKPVLEADWPATLKEILRNIELASNSLPSLKKSMPFVRNAAATSFAALAQFNGDSLGQTRRKLRTYLILQEAAAADPNLAQRRRLPVLNIPPGRPAAERLHAELELASQNGAAALRNLEKGQQPAANDRALMMMANLFRTVETDRQGGYGRWGFLREGLTKAAAYFQGPSRRMGAQPQPSLSKVAHSRL